MKRLTTLILFFLLFSFFTSAQNLPANFNLVPNSSLELTNTPTLDTTFNNNSTCWIAPNANLSPLLQNFTIGAQPHTGDYFGLLIFGYGQYAISAQQWVHIPNTIADTCECLRTYYETKLLEPLVAGQTYYFSVHAGGYTGNTNLSVIGNVGGYFSTSQISDHSNFGRMNVVPQVNFTHWTFPATGNFEYVKLTGSFVAAGGERYLTVGNFDYINNFTFAFFDPLAITNDTTYGTYNGFFIDDVSLVRDTTQPMISLAEFNIGNDTLLCPSQSLTIGGEDHFFHYWWNTGDTTRFITVTQPGTYWCTVDFGCNTFTDTIHVLSPQNLNFNINDTAVCPGTQLTFTSPVAAPSYLWSNGSTTSSINTSIPGTYWLQVSSTCGSYADTFTLTNQNITIPPFSIPDTTLCPAQIFYQATAPQGYSYIWSNGATTQTTTLNSTGNHWVQLTNTCGNTASDTFAIATYTLVPLQLPLSDTTICNGESFILAAPSGYLQYQWSTGSNSNSITINDSGVYTLQADDLCNTYTDSVSVAVLANPAGYELGADTSICSNSSLTLTGPTGFNYLWSTGETTPAITVSQAGTYSLSISNICGNATDSINIATQQAPGLFVNISGELSICKNGVPSTTTLSAPTGIYDMLWNTGDTTSSITVSIPGSYSLILRNGCGSARGEVYVSGCKGIVTFPSVFSPNGDGKNEVFRAIIQDGNMIEDFLLKVYNRYGNCVYESTDPFAGWDGSRSDVGVYYFYCDYKDRGKSKQMIKGDVTLLR